ncbi:MAG: exodeoxyribonuclease III [Rugosibacter sp.]|jgi:exodeoxyribonuclease-3|nr:exodeoxyribonuclease III [Rugosibacter sp.]
MKIATWNVNSFKVRLPHVLDWLAATQTDVLCVQETKMEDKVFPYAELQAAGYHAVHNGQKTYNGVAILSRFEMAGVCFDIPAFDDPQKRVLAATIKGVRIVCGYMPNGQAVGSEKYDYKLKWFAALTRWLQQEMAQHTQMALLGDFNIAPEDRDVHDPVAWKDQILCSEPERAAFRQLQALGLQDAFRLFDQPEKIFSWWDYRQMGFRLNRGLRIDHILLNPELAGRCRSCVVDKAPRKLERPSDHAPVVAELDELSAADQPGPSGNG